MNKQLFIEVTHANTGAKIFVVVAQIFSMYFSETHKATLLLAAAGAMLPCKESVDEIKSKITGVS